MSEHPNWVGEVVPGVPKQGPALPPFTIVTPKFWIVTSAIPNSLME
jgi:hypothetical protein